MSRKLLWSKTIVLDGLEEFKWFDDAIATISNALKTGKKSDFQGWIGESLSRRIKEVPDIRLTKGCNYWAAHSVSEGDELIELHEVIFQQFLWTFRGAEEITIKWAEISPMCESDGFGGGFTVITANGSTKMTIDSYLENMKNPSP